jgi:hypothetical protein
MGDSLLLSVLSSWFSVLRSRFLVLGFGIPHFRLITEKFVDEIGGIEDSGAWRLKKKSFRTEWMTSAPKGAVENSLNRSGKPLRHPKSSVTQLFRQTV